LLSLLLLSLLLLLLLLLRARHCCSAMRAVPPGQARPRTAAPETCS
jgi:hypothetical protein